MVIPNPPQPDIGPGSPAPEQPLSGDPGLAQSRASQRDRYKGVELWLHRITMLMFVFVCASMGVLLIILPWRPEWTDNHFLSGYPGLRELAGSGFIRGLCSGLGLLDIWVGFWEALHYHEEKGR
jgi:hypothetical protein